MLTLSYMSILIIVLVSFFLGLISPLFLIIYWLMRAEVK